MTELTLIMGDAELRAIVPAPRTIADGGGERVFLGTKIQSTILGEALDAELTAWVAALTIAEVS